MQRILNFGVLLKYSNMPIRLRPHFVFSPFDNIEYLFIYDQLYAVRIALISVNEAIVSIGKLAFNAKEFLALQNCLLCAILTEYDWISEVIRHTRILFLSLKVCRNDVIACVLGFWVIFVDF